jgi:hypothetical protein
MLGVRGSVYTNGRAKALWAMNVVDQIVAEERERKKREEDKRRREDAAYDVVMALPEDGQRAVLVRLIDAAAVRREPSKSEEPKPSSAPKSQTNGAGRSETFVEKAERYVLLHPEGVKTRQVADAIGQDVSAVDTTLRVVMNKRETIERRGRLWFPKGTVNAEASKPKKNGIRELIYEVFAVEKGPLSSAAIYRGLQKLKQGINKSSVDGEINRMRHHSTPPLLVQVGTGENNGGLYALANGGAQTAATN